MVAAELFFGVEGRGLEARFVDFLDRSVTPRFPAGLTVLDGAGRWRAGNGRMTAERSKLVLIVADPGEETVARLQAVRGEYKARFGQESVGLMLSRVCADF